MSDFCYSWPIFNRVFQQAKLMDRMMERLDVSQAAAVRLSGGKPWYEARTRCIDCVHESCCKEWLESASCSRIEPDFCPDARFFQECKEAKSKRSSYPGLQASHASQDDGGNEKR